MTKLLNGRHFEGGAAGRGAAGTHTALQCCGGIAISFSILRSTFYPNLKQIGRKWQSYWMGAILKVAWPKMAPQWRVRRCSVAAALLNHSTSYDLPTTRILSKLAERWQSYWMGAILRAARSEMAPLGRVRRLSVVVALLHHFPSYNLRSTRIWNKLAEKWQSYWIGAIFRVAP